MTQILTQDNQLLKQLWSIHNQSNQQHLDKQKVIEWTKNSLQKINILQNYHEQSINLNELIRQYLSEIHSITQQSYDKISLTYKEAVQFLNWLKKKNNNIDQIPKNIEKIQQKADKLQQKHQQRLQQDQQEQNNNLNQENINENNNQELLQNNHKQTDDIQRPIQDQQTNQFIQQNNTKQKISYKAKTDADNFIDRQRQQQLNQNQTTNPNEFNIDHITKKYKEYLKIIFEHYCKMSYATGQDPTFQQIMHKTTIMTINKFMIFAKDFEISKIKSTMNRAYIIQIFKKNSQCYKQMSYQQFIDAFHKLSITAFSQSKQSQQSQGISSQVIKMLEYCQLSTSKKFKQKMKKLNIQYRTGPKTNAQLKIVPDNYKFKFISNNGKSQQQIKQQIYQRKINRSQKKIFNQKMNNHDLSLNKKIRQKNKELQRKTSNYKQQNQSQSTNVINKILTPLIPPQKRQMPIIPKPPVLTPSQQNKTNNSNSNIFKKQLGYADIHKMKVNDSYSRKRINSKSSKISDSMGHYKLNSIVQQARLQVQQDTQQIYQNNYQNGYHRQNLSQSIQTNSRQQTLRTKAYDINKINSKMQIISDKVKKQRQIQEQLNDLLDIQNGDDDQYLRQHLLRQQKNQVLNKRLSNRINQLDYK